MKGLGNSRNSTNHHQPREVITMYLSNLNAAATSAATLHHLPPMESAEAMASALKRLGLLPTGVQAAAAERMFANGFKVSVHEVDRALREHSTLDISRRIQFKAALGRFGLLK
jgi:hypothetical protein